MQIERSGVHKAWPLHGGIIYLSIKPLLASLVLFDPCREKQTDRFRTPFHGLSLEARVVAGCLFFFTGLEKDKGALGSFSVAPVPYH